MGAREKEMTGHVVGSVIGSSYVFVLQACRGLFGDCVWGVNGGDHHKSMYMRMNSIHRLIIYIDMLPGW